VNCNEFDEQITPAVDDRLRADEAAAFREHAALCPPCRSAYEAERSTRAFIRQRMRLVPAPGRLTAAITDRLSAEPGAATPTFPWLWSPRVYRPAFAVAAIVAAVYLLSSSRFSGDPALPQMREDIFAGSIVTYAGLVGGQMKPDVESSRPDVLQSFFNGKTSFPVHVHVVRDCTPVGAMLHETAGVPLAQVLYNSAGVTVYVYQTCWRTVQDGRKLHLPGHILSALRRGESYAEENADGQTLIVWTEGRTLCGAVANMHKADLFARLDVIPTPDTP
jgi:anti-sigma factor (TIGR02949 family)